MRKLFTLFIIIISSLLQAQSPCQEGKILINGVATDAVFIENSDITGLNLPLWLNAGTSLAAGDRVHIISVIEFNEVIQAGNTTLVYNQVKTITTVVETVPAGKVWKVEAIVKHANAFTSGFTASSNSPVCKNSQINLSAVSVSGATYSWTGPNGFTSSLQNPVITNAGLAASGTYTMTATLNGCTSTPVTTVVVVNDLPSSAFTYNPSQIIINNNTVFTPAVSGANYSWAFDSGNPAAASSENPAVQWSTPGNYNVSLTVIDNNNCSSSTQQTVNVSSCLPGQPSSDFTWVPGNPQPGNQVTLYPVTTGATYLWNISGGSISTSALENPTVTWTGAGSYNVELTVTLNGCSSVTDKNVIVSNPVTETFNYTGGSQTFTVPAGVNSLKLEVWGAAGGYGIGSNEILGGLGAYVYGDISVTPGDLLTIYVGGVGGAGTGGSGGAAGYNGGGSGGYSSGGGGGGGGASDIRIGGTSLSNRVIVAGGGGGGSAYNCGSGGTGGYPSGGVCPVTCFLYGGAGSQSAGGTAGSGGSAGGLGYGGNASNSGCSGGGGGGYYGGGGGGSSCCGGSGGGGSSYYGTLTNTGTSNGVQSGNGLVKITY